ncbi:MAG: CBS domain-containing protein [Clostridia bacterium]|nr:CBS domain-containing protein [Clostridia bacterium]
MNVLRFILPKSSVEYIYTTSTVRQALEKMQYHHYVAIPVLDEDGTYVGTLRNDDLFKYFLKGGAFDARAAERDSVMRILDKDYSKPITHNATMNQLIENVKEHNFVPVVDDRGCFIGIVLRRDILNYLLKYYESQNGEK